MKNFFKNASLIVILIAVCFLAACAPAETLQNTEQQQQGKGVLAIAQNQPVPDLGGYSFERQIVIDTYKARNNTISTWSYQVTIDGKIIEICPSIGYPIPYSTQLTNPMVWI